MSDGRNGGPPNAGPGAHPPDPRGVRVIALGMDEVAPLVVEPAAVPIGPVERTAGLGVLGGVAPAPATGFAHGSDVGLTANGEPLAATFSVSAGGHGTLRLGAGAGSDGAGGTYRVLVIDDVSVGGGTQGVMRREVVVDGWRVELEVEPAARAALRERAQRGRQEAGKTGPSEVHAIIPGVVVSVSIAAGDQVVAGQQLLVVEAMKMQNELRAPRDGTIERVAVGPGTTIEVGDLLLVIT